MKKIFFLLFILPGLSFILTFAAYAENVVLENAEDGDTINWSIYDNDPAGTTGTISNVADPIDPSNRVIQLSGGGTNTGYRYSFPEPDESKFKSQWKMKYNESYTVYFDCLTTAGHRYIYYTASDTDYLGTAEYVHHGLRLDTQNGRWVTIRRDLQRDLWDAQPGNNIISVNAFLIRGSGFIDDIVNFSYADADCDLIPDEVETSLGLNPDDPSETNEDLDNDGLTNLEEIIYGTDLDNSDSDGDGLTDYFELKLSSTDPNNTDTDANGTTDDLEDTDIDGINNLDEQNAGTNPDFPSIQGNGYIYDMNILEDAEAGDAINWSIYDNDPAGTITNVIDPLDPSNRVIQLSGGGADTGYCYSFPEPDCSGFKYQWRMKYNESYTVYFDCLTTAGHRFIYYTSSDSDNPGDGEYVHHGLGLDTQNGSWVTIHRDLQRDLWDAQPGNNIISVNAFLFRGSGFIDDIVNFSYADADCDFIPDEVEISLGLNPDDPSETNEDLDNDGLANLEEIIYGTDLDNSDSDGDGLTDYFELKLSSTDPNNTDTDANETTDDLEDTDIDGINNLDEQNAGTDPNKPTMQGNGYIYDMNILEDAEDGDAINWNIYDNDPAGTTGTISNVAPPIDPSNRVIQLSGRRTNTGYRYSFPEPDYSGFKYQWRMKYNEFYTLYFDCLTTEGHRFIYYTSSDSDNPGDGEYVHHGLGLDTQNGSWITIRRDLQRDLWDAQPGNNIISVNAFLFRGSGFIDDIVNFSYADADYDLIPDEVEISLGLNPDDPSETNEDLDNDGLTNLEEIIYGTDLDNSDSDGDSISDEWEIYHGLNPNLNDISLDYDGDGLTNLEEYNANTDPLKTDTDGDGLNDAYELQVSLTDPLNQDTDGDGLSDYEEVQNNLDPNNPTLDTDGDGVSDYAEIYQAFTNPLAVDFDLTDIQDILTISGADISASLGDWREYNGSIFCANRRGYVEYNAVLPTADTFRLKINISEYYPGDAVFTIRVFIDDEYVSRQSVSCAFEASEYLDVFTPYLTAGQHAIRIFWDGYISSSALQIDSLIFQRVGGPDENSNNVPDWIDNRLNNMCSVNGSPVITSKISPLCVEGKGRYLSMMTLSDNATINKTDNNRWYANIPLLANEAKTLDISFQNGVKTETLSVIWAQTNLFTETQPVIIRKGDSLLLNAYPDGVTSGAYSIDCDGAAYTGDIGTPSPVIFNSTGTFILTGTYTADDQTRQTASLEVTVVEYAFSDTQPACWSNHARTWDIPKAPEQIKFEADSSLTEFRLGDYQPDNTTRYYITAKNNDDSNVIARLTENGPIIDHTTARGLDIFSSYQTYVCQIDTYEDGSKVYEMLVISSPVIEDVSLDLHIFAAGIVFDDGTVEKILTADDFDPLGCAKVYFIYPPEAQSSVCHTLKLYQNNIYIGQRY